MGRRCVSPFKQNPFDFLSSHLATAANDRRRDSEMTRRPPCGGDIDEVEISVDNRSSKSQPAPSLLSLQQKSGREELRKEAILYAGC
jgi:hypothetical protein